MKMQIDWPLFSKLIKYSKPSLIQTALYLADQNAVWTGEFVQISEGTLFIAKSF